MVFVLGISDAVAVAVDLSHLSVERAHVEQEFREGKGAGFAEEFLAVEEPF